MKQPKTFEEGIARLKELLEALNQENTSLGDSVKIYADAAALIQYCHSCLEKHKLQIEEIDLQLAQLEEKES